MQKKVISQATCDKTKETEMTSPIASRVHHRKCGEPQVSLGLTADPFTLFYDYDQLCDRKLSTLTPLEKSRWLKRRIDMSFIEPLRRVLKEEEIFHRLMRTIPEDTVQCCFSIAIMSVMLSGVEALGSFIQPDLAQRPQPPNRELFNCFMRKYMREWNKPAAMLERTVLDILWKHFRIGITHGFQIKPHGSLEFLESERFRVEGGLFQVCPEHFFDDLSQGTRQYFSDLEEGGDLLQKFHRRFLIVYPC